LEAVIHARARFGGNFVVSRTGEKEDALAKAPNWKFRMIGQYRPNLCPHLDYAFAVRPFQIRMFPGSY
jgi:hypothetical protein